MYRVEVLKQCGCFTKNGMIAVQTFKTQAEAKAEANKLLKTMNNDFCGKHSFAIIESGGNFKIVEEE
ncbi:MAG: hypothetical protein RL154_1233 [Pseudomonadota bacterium]|jgi:hypothetical protein